MTAQEEGWFLGCAADAPAMRAGCEAYLGQLCDENLARRGADGWLISWDALYKILGDSEHAGSVELLGVPSSVSWVPRIESRSTPSDANFQIIIVQWLDERRVAVDAVQRVGATLKTNRGTFLLSRESWELVVATRALARDGPDLGQDERMRRVGSIRDQAVGCGAPMDRYLQQTRISRADSLQLQLRRTESLGTSVVEVIPGAKGADAAGFVDQFDRYSSVRSRYDVPASDGGITHVLPGAAVQAALISIKARPGRRFSGAEAQAFLRNPEAVLGAEAAGAIDEEEFAAARRSAGVQLVRIQVEDATDKTGFVIRITDVDGVNPDRVRLLASRTEVEGLCNAACGSRTQGRPLYAWHGEDVECSAETDALVQQTQRWLMTGAVDLLSVRYAEVFDLTAYSDRVVGFDGRPLAVPYVARKDSSRDWIPENVEYGVLPLAGGLSVPSQPIPLGAEQIAALTESVWQARDSGAATVSVPGLDQPVPIEEAQQWVESFKADVGHRKSKREPRPEKDPPQDVERPVLRILHNIESLDYQKPGVAAKETSVGRASLPDGLRAETRLLPHQAVGVAWIQQQLARRRKGLTGCLLADDMGLGKTLQALCVIARYLEAEPGARPCLVVAPVSLLENWKAEVDRFFGSFPGKIVTLYGETLAQFRVSSSQVDQDLRELGLRKFLAPGFERGTGLVLTTYETLRDYEFSLARVSWGVVVCDEAQKIKTPRALMTRAAKALKADFRIACTGTPVENSLADLWCLFDFIQPGLLGSLNEFTRVFRKVIETRSNGHESLVQKLRIEIDPWVLRRLKTDVAQLPPKHEGEDPLGDPECQRLPMSALQRGLYAATVREFRSALKDSNRKGGARILQTLLRLRMVCSNPVAVSEDVSEAADVEQQLKHSPKLHWLVERLAVIKQQGEKIIVFTEFRDIQRLIQRAIVHRFGIPVTVINGSTGVDPTQDTSRQKLIDQFQAAPGFGVIILSTTAVGFGVNVQGANHVVHFTRPWNPAKEDQATDRAYRIGQTRPVTVYCPTVQGDGFESFDQRVAQLLAEKRALSRDMLAGAQEISLDDFGGL